MKSGEIIPNYKYFESQEGDEKVIFVLRKHWTVLVAPLFAGAGILILSTVIGLLVKSFDNIVITEVGETIMACVFSLIILFTTLYVFMSWLIHYLDVVILTDEHLVEIQQLSLFSRKTSELDLDCIEDASSSQKGIVQTLLKYGNVLIQTAGELPNFNLNNFEDPDGIQQRIMEAKEHYMKSNLYNKGNANIMPPTPTQPVKETTPVSPVTPITKKEAEVPAPDNQQSPPITPGV
jgi:type III secretory pathway component EscS